MLTTPKVKVLHFCLEALDNEEFSIEESVEFEHAIEVLRANGKTYLTPNMSPFENDFTSDNCFWLLLHHQGVPIGGIAARRDRIGDETLSDFWRRSLRRQYGHEAGERVLPLSETVKKEVKGEITYFGDLILKKEYRLWGTHLRCFTMYAQMLAAVKWDSDWAYSFIGESRAENGGAWSYGFSRVSPGPQEWLIETPTRGSKEFCVYNSRSDLTDMARHYSRFPEKLRVIEDARRAVGSNDGK